MASTWGVASDGLVIWRFSSFVVNRKWVQLSVLSRLLVVVSCWCRRTLGASQLSSTRDPADLGPEAAVASWLQKLRLNMFWFSVACASCGCRAQPPPEWDITSNSNW